MAGYIQITEREGLGMSSLSFSAISENTRAYLSEAEKLKLKKAYEALDEGCLDIISLAEEDVPGFNIFLNALIINYGHTVVQGRCGSLSGKYLPGVISMMEELITKLKIDPRSLIS